LLVLNSVLHPQGVSWTDRFEDLMETVSELYFQVRMHSPQIDRIRKYAAKAAYPTVYQELVELWVRTADKASPALSRQAALTEAIDGLCVLIMHIAPHRPGIGVTILRAMRNICPPDNWLTRQDVWFAYYRQLDRKITMSKTLRKRFTLAMPLGEHRFVADTVFFTAAVIEKVLLDPDLVTAVFPTLLELLTQESFAVLPVLAMERVRGRSLAHIKVIHTTYRSRRTPDRLALTKEQEAAEMAKTGRTCFVTPIFTALIRSSYKFRISNRKDRAYKCFQVLLELLPSLLRQNVSAHARCSGCVLLYREGQFQSACQTIIGMSAQTKRALVEAAKNYERFLHVDTMRAVQKKWSLPQAPHPVRHYRFL
jgi:hypothetical protein